MNRRDAIVGQRVRLAVCTLNLYGDGMRPNARGSLQHAAARWGAEYLEIEGGLLEGTDIVAEKLRLDEHLKGYDQVIYFDRDIVVRSDCPNPFSIVPANSFAAATSEQLGHFFADRILLHISPLSARFGVSVGLPDYFNTGVLVFSPQSHHVLFEKAREVRAVTDDYDWTVSDQGPVSIAAKIIGIPIIRLNHDFNRCGSCCWEDWTPAMPSYVLHFCGSKPGRDKKIDETVWQVPPLTTAMH